MVKDTNRWQDPSVSSAKFYPDPCGCEGIGICLSWGSVFLRGKVSQEGRRQAATPTKNTLTQAENDAPEALEPNHQGVNAHQHWVPGRFS